MSTNSWQQHLPKLLLFLAVIGYALYFIWLTFLRFDAFEARALDLGNFDQAIWNTSQGRWFHLTNQEGIVNRLSLHVEPILIPISWLYWIYSSPKTLLFLQSVVVSLGALFVYGLAHIELKNGWLSLIFAGSFLLNPSIQAANWLEFHGLTLAPTFLLAAFYFLRTKQNTLFILSAILAASCKEEIALLVLMMGLYAFLFMKRRRLGIVTMALSLTWALVAVLGIQQLFGNGNIHWGRYAYLGESPLQIVTAIVTQPSVVWSQLQKADAFVYLIRHLIPVGFLGVLAPEVLFMALPSLGLNLLADFSPMHQIDTLIYAAPIVPFATLSGVFGAHRLLNRWSPEKFRSLASWLVGIFIVSAGLANQWAYGYLPGSGHYQFLAITDHHRQAEEMIRQIPADAKVSAQDRLNPHVSQRETIYIFPRVEDADTVFLDVTGSPWPQHPNDIHKQVNQLLISGFGIAAAQDGYLLLSQNAINQDMPPSFYSAWQADTIAPATGANPINVTFGDLFKLVGLDVFTDRNGELVIKLFWQILDDHLQDVNFHVAYLDRSGTPLHTTQFYPLPATLWYPTSLWTVSASDDISVTSFSNVLSDTQEEDPQRGNTTEIENVRTYVVQTLPWNLESEQFTLAVGLFWAEDGADWSSGKRLPVTEMEQTYPLLEGGTLLRIGGYEQVSSRLLPSRNIQSAQWVAQQASTSPPTQIMDAKLGGQIALSGVTLETNPLQAQESLKVNLHWRITSPIELDYSLFFHLLNSNGDVVAQLDRQPEDVAGFLPMTSWPLQYEIVDPVVLDLPESLPPGSYRMLAGLYFWQDGQRLLVTGANATAENGVDLGRVIVE
ncbi:MAG: DUF2079 domain-containing protein [Chloroflexota bacterium]